VSTPDTAPARLPEPPYYAVIFTAVRTPGDNGYEETSQEMLALAAEQPGYLGVDTARGENGLGITVSYWRDEESIRAWRRNAEHATAQNQGRKVWYESFATHVARVERANSFPR